LLEFKVNARAVWQRWPTAPSGTKEDVMAANDSGHGRKTAGSRLFAKAVLSVAGASAATLILVQATTWALTTLRTWYLATLSTMFVSTMVVAQTPPGGDLAAQPELNAKIVKRTSCTAATKILPQ
jgi:hypothetical protein